MSNSLLQRALGHRPRPIRRGLVVLGLLALGVLCAVVVSGCGGSSNASGSATTAATTTAAASTVTTSTGTSTNASANFAAYRSCLTAHGVTGFPAGGGFRRGGGFGAGGTSTTGTTPAVAPPASTTGTTPTIPRRTVSAADQKALAACASLRPTGGFGGFGGGRGAGGGGGFAGFSSDPKFVACLKSHGVPVSSTGTPSFSGGASSSLRTAFAACRSLLPAGSLGGGAAGGGGFGGAGAGGANSTTFARYQACLKSHGIQPGAAGGAPSTKLTAAIAACRSVLSSGSTTTATTPATTTG